ncbi:MAG: hypothetical protein Q9160_001906 [Pyrenula sp. 1 TL-2023]
MASSPDDFRFIFNNIILPRKLPHKADDTDCSKQDKLVDLVTRSWLTYTIPNGYNTSLWNSAHAALVHLKQYYISGKILQTEIQRAFQTMNDNDYRIVPIRCQNAAILVSRTAQGFVIECFEVSPQNDKVMSTARLRMAFPAQAMLVPAQSFLDETFQIAFCNFLNQLNATTVDAMVPQTRKARTFVAETRDTAHPDWVTRLLFAILATEGSTYTPVSITKNIRDDVCYKDTLVPWRRCPLWLMIRVSLQTMFARTRDARGAPDGYKDFMCHLFSEFLDQAVADSRKSEHLHSINLKLGRRMAKLGPSSVASTASNTIVALERSRTLLQKRWSLVQHQHQQNWGLAPDTGPEDIKLKLTKAEEYVRSRLNCVDNSDLPGPLDIDQLHFWTRLDLSPNCLPSVGIFKDHRTPRAYALFDFESWVGDNLLPWSKTVCRTDTTCDELSSLIRAYYDSGRDCYRGDAKQLSIMYLTIIELWCVLDQIAISVIPLIQQIFPEIPATLLEPLLLSSRGTLSRLAIVEAYVRSRKGGISAFGSIGPNFFGVRYFDTCSGMQNMKRRIENDAQNQKQQKQIEWESMERRHSELKQQADIENHKCNYYGVECRKCALLNSMEQLKIRKFEWPLPLNNHRAKAIIFELLCPTGFKSWRDITWMILKDFESMSVETHQVEHILPIDDAVWPYRQCSTRHTRITLASTTKTFMQSHYEYANVPCTFDVVSVPNGLTYELFDQNSRLLTANIPRVPNIKDKCTLSIDATSYSTLQWMLTSYEHSENRVLAAQNSCPPHLSLHEYYAFGTLRSGERLQWVNILRELKSSDLHWNAIAIRILIEQTIWEAGHPGFEPDYRASQDIFTDANFGNILLEAVTLKFVSIKANWNELHCMGALTAIVAQARNFCRSVPLQQKAHDILLSIRKTLVAWVDTLFAHLQDLLDPEKIRQCQDRICHACMCCHATFDTTQGLDEPAIFADADAVAMFVQCSILLQDNQPASLPTELLHLRRRNERIILKLFPNLQNLAARASPGFWQGISKIWDSAGNATPWGFVDSGKLWITCSTADNERSKPQNVLYNLFDGKLLVDGKRVGRLPTEMEAEPVYRELFGSRIFKVIPSNIRGLWYQTTHQASGHTIHFGYLGSNLIIRAVSADEELELVDRKFFVDELPQVLISDAIPWLDLRHSQIYLRPRKHPWRHDKSDWHISFATSSVLASLRDRHLVDYMRPIARYLASVFKVLEHQKHIVISRTLEGLIEIDLARLRLHFFVRADRLIQCKELKAIVDIDQDIGTLIGLESRLVLRGVYSRSSKLNRLVVVPYGQAQVEGNGGHVRVSITSPQSPVIHYMTLVVDHTLNYLRRLNPEPQARFYHALLQALCSGIQPDPLTQRTGTEEAVSCLQSAAAFGCTPLSDESISILQEIAKISPKRGVYPSHLRVMEVTDWRSDLPWISQVDELQVAVQAIIHHNNQFRSLHGLTDCIELDRATDSQLVERALNRAIGSPSTLLASDQDFSSNELRLVARDRVSTASSPLQSQAAFEIATLLKTWGDRNQVDSDLYQQFRTWKHIAGFGEDLNPFDLSVPATRNIKEIWGALYGVSSSSVGAQNRWKLCFLFAPFAFRKPDLLPHLRTLLEFSFRPIFPGFSEVPNGGYDISLGHEPSSLTLQDIIAPHRIVFRSIQRGELRSSYNQQKELHETNTRQHCERLAALAIEAWPYPNVSLPDALDQTLFRAGYVKHLNEHLAAVYRNRQLYLACHKVQDDLRSHHLRSVSNVYRTRLPDFLLPNGDERACMSYQRPDLGRVMATRECHPAIPKPAFTRRIPSYSANSGSCSELDNLINVHMQRGGSTRQKYGYGLNKSLRAFGSSVDEVPFQGFSDLEQLDSERLEHEKTVDGLVSSLSDDLGPQDLAERAMYTAGLWPRQDIRAILHEVSHRRSGLVQPVWRRRILQLGQAITMFQRATRLLVYAEAKNKVLYHRELLNQGYHGWLPDQYPDWLLMQIEQDFLIRPIQVDVAKQMILPTGSISATMQLNMGEGKSAVIIPMVITALANGECLARVVVLKPLFNQMNRVLRDRLGGLVGRRILSIPFHRQTPVSPQQIETLSEMYKSWEARGDIMLVQPEHMLSFKLMALDRLYSGQLRLAELMLGLWSWLRGHCRNLLDESDELLSPNFELVYTIGNQRLVSGQPDRWIIAQRVLSLIEKNITNVQQQHPLGVELIPKSKGAFPSIRLLNESVASDLVTQIVADIGRGILPELSFEHCSSQFRDAVLAFITRQRAHPNDIQTVLNEYQESTAYNNILVLRGLIGHGIIFHALHQKRWTVNYGQDYRRCLMAVPYRAKGVPSLSAEFGHPVCAIILTCLSFYYTGLSEEQLLQSFHLLFTMADPALEYDTWQKRLDLPTEIRSVAGVNLDDARQWNEIIYPCFTMNKATIDFFLTSVVFPREAKEFDFKLTTSGWDLAAECVNHLTTGFSGTNDLRFLNPLSIQHLDIPELLKTSALVLRNLLIPSNRKLLIAPQGDGQVIDGNGLIALANEQDPEVQVIIDVGAQVLDLSNRNVIEHWLSIKEAAVAGVYLDEDDCPMVLDRLGISERLDVSGFCGNLNQCVVFLDEAHTRGIDLDLPDNFRAMVTLGPNMTKDRFVQACMRMRKLAQGQSIVTFAPSEIRDSILKLLGKSRTDSIDISAAISWLLEQTCQQIDKYYPMWLNKGLSHTRRRIAYELALSASGGDLRNLVNNKAVVDALMGSTKEREARTLSELYNNQSNPFNLDQIVEEAQDEIAQRLIQEYNTIDDSNRLRDATIHEEQEREIEFQVENEREVERPPDVDAAIPRIDADVKNLVTYGRMSSALPSRSFHQAYSIIAGTTAKAMLPNTAITSNLLVTSDYTRVVVLPPDGTTDEFLRPVRWILTSNKTNSIFVFSQFEANELLPSIRKANEVSLHVYAPRVSKQMHSFHGLDVLRISGLAKPNLNLGSDVLTSLHLFSGALYFDAHLHYRQLCEFLGVVGAGQPVNAGAEVETDGFIRPEHRGGNGWSQTRFSRNPLPLVKAILGMRRKGENYAGSHMGRIVSGRVMSEEEFA